MSAAALSNAQRPGTLLITNSANLVAQVASADVVTSDEFKVHRIRGDGKCFFRATARALAMNKGVFLTAADEEAEADKLRMACYDALCRTSHRRSSFPDAEKQIRFGYGDIDGYCRNLGKPSFWGGEVEMMVLAKMLQVPIYVYQPAREKGGAGSGFSITAKFGHKFAVNRESGKHRRPVRLLLSGNNHFDLLL